MPVSASKNAKRSKVLKAKKPVAKKAVVKKPVVKKTVVKKPIVKKPVVKKAATRTVTNLNALGRSPAENRGKDIFTKAEVNTIQKASELLKLKGLGRGGKRK